MIYDYQQKPTSTSREHYIEPVSPWTGILRKLAAFLLFTFAAYYFILTLTVSIHVGKTPLIYRLSKGMVWKGGYSYNRFRQFDKNKKYDIIVLGSSRANRGFDPEVFRSNGFNLFNL